MILLQTFSKKGVKITLTTERWNHIIMRHPEMDKSLEDIKEVLQNPDIIVQNSFDQTIIFYHKYYKEDKLYIVLVVEEKKGFIITGYTTPLPKRGRILWQKK